MGTLLLRAALKRGALVTAVNWPVVLIDFVLESFYKLAMAVPVVGGALMLVAIAGADLRTVMSEGVMATADLVVDTLMTAPVALTAFFAALATVGLAGAIVMFVVKAGTLAVIVTSERASCSAGRSALDIDAWRDTAVYRLDLVLEGARRFGRRAAVLAFGLALVYVVVGGAYLAVVSYGFALAIRSSWTPAWPLLVLLSTSIGLVVIAGVNLGYDLLRVIVVTDDCAIREAVSRLRRFVTEDARQVIGIFSVIGGIMFVATLAAVLAAGGLTLMAWVPIVGLVIVPLQAAAWVIRGMLFQYLAISALAAYQTQYRRFSDLRWPTARRADEEAS